MGTTHRWPTEGGPLGGKLHCHRQRLSCDPKPPCWVIQDCGGGDDQLKQRPACDPTLSFQGIWDEGGGEDQTGQSVVGDLKSSSWIIWDDDGGDDPAPLPVCYPSRASYSHTYDSFSTCFQFFFWPCRYWPEPGGGKSNISLARAQYPALIAWLCECSTFHMSLKRENNL